MNKTDSDYKILYKHYESCFDKYGDNNKGVDWPNEEQANTRYEIMLDVIKNKQENVKLLDFGCGLSHLYTYIKNNNIHNIDYIGCDISQKFIQASKEKYTENEYFTIDILNEELKNKYDYIIANGVFTEKREMTYEQMYEFFTNTIVKLFNFANKAIAFNVMSKQVDWERDDLFHVPLDDLAWFLHKNKMRNFIIRNDYGLWEYTVYIYKEVNL